MNIMLDSTALMPKRGHATDAGLDLLSPIDTVVPANGSISIDTGVHIVMKIDIPELNVVDEFKETERGNGGFGSTGR